MEAASAPNLPCRLPGKKTDAVGYGDVCETGEAGRASCEVVEPCAASSVAADMSSSSNSMFQPMFQRARGGDQQAGHACGAL